MLNYILLFCIAVSYCFIYFYAKQNFFTSLGKEYASSTKRIFAVIIDWLMIYIMATAYLFYLLATNLVFRKELGVQLMDMMNTGDFTIFSRLATQFFIAVLVYFLYTITLQSSALSATLGQYWLDLKVTKFNSNKSAGFIAIIIRNIIKIPVAFLLPLTYVFSRMNPERQWIHDKIAKTIVRDIEEK